MKSQIDQSSPSKQNVDESNNVIPSDYSTPEEPTSKTSTRNLNFTETELSERPNIETDLLLHRPSTSLPTETLPFTKQTDGITQKKNDNEPDTQSPLIPQRVDWDSLVSKSRQETTKGPPGYQLNIDDKFSSWGDENIPAETSQAWSLASILDAKNSPTSDLSMDQLAKMPVDPISSFEVEEPLPHDATAQLRSRKQIRTPEGIHGLLLELRDFVEDQNYNSTVTTRELNENLSALKFALSRINPEMEARNNHITHRLAQRIASIKEHMFTFGLILIGVSITQLGILVLLLILAINGKS